MPQANEPVTIRTLLRMKRKGERIAALTAYDYPSALLAEKAGADLVLVGDSLGMVVQGHDSTLPVTLDEMVYHSRMVARACCRSLVLADMPFGSYQTGVPDGVAAAVRLLKEGGVAGVKVEGAGEWVLDLVRRLVSAGVPVMGHVGLTPQSVHQLGGYRMQGRGDEAARCVRDAARALADAGAFALVLELIPATLAGAIRTDLDIPVIGIGAGADCDGQILVFHDVLGITRNYVPSFVRQYEQLGSRAQNALECYCRDVREGVFPAVPGEKEGGGGVS